MYTTEIQLCACGKNDDNTMYGKTFKTYHQSIKIVDIQLHNKQVQN